MSGSGVIKETYMRVSPSGNRSLVEYFWLDYYTGKGYWRLIDSHVLHESNKHLDSMYKYVLLSREVLSKGMLKWD